MKPLLQIISLLLFSCSLTVNNEQKHKSKRTFTETEILDELDLAFNGTPSQYFPSGRPQNIKYNFFLDLKHGLLRDSREQNSLVWRFNKMDNCI